MARRYVSIPITVSIILLQSARLLAQAPDTLWTRTYGDIQGFDGNSIQPSIDGGFIVAGAGGDSLWGYGASFIMKIDDWGNAIWSQREGAPYGAAYNCAAQGSDGTILAGGWWRSIMGGRRSGALAYSDSGNPIWGVDLYSDGFQQDGVNWIENIPQGGFVLIDDPRDDQTNRFDLRATRVDSIGQPIWSRIYGDSLDELPGAVRLDVNGGFIIAGGTASFGAGDLDGYLIRTNDTGDTIWTGTYGGRYPDSFEEIVQSSDGGYVAVGTTYSFGYSGANIYVVRTNATGDTVWTRAFGTESDDFGFSIDRVLSGGYIVAGTGAGHALLLRINDGGDTIWTISFPYEQSRSSANSVIALPDSGFAFTGYITQGGQNPSGLWVVRLAPEVVGVDEPPAVIPENMNLSQNYPNPFNGRTIIHVETKYASNQASLDIYNLAGQLVSTLFNGDMQPGFHRFTWDGRDKEGRELSSGIYFYKLQSGSFASCKKMVLLR